MEIVCATTILKADSEMPKPDRDDAARLDELMAEAPSEKPTDQMLDEELKAARMRTLDKLVELSQELGFYDEPFVSNKPLVRKE